MDTPPNEHDYEPIKVVFNDEPGGFRLSTAALNVAREMWDVDWEDEYPYRHDPRLVKLVDMLGDAASGPSASLACKILEGNTYHIIEHNNGQEEVLEPDDLYWTTVGNTR
jgi:hypothetical protein